MSKTVETLRSDYKYLESWDITNAEKKALAEKYGSPTKKAKDIQYQILILLREDRKNRNEYTTEDLKDFSNLNTGISLYKKMSEALDNENPLFAQFYFHTVSKKLEEKGWEKYLDWSLNSLKYVRGLAWYQVDFLCKEYKNLAKYLESKTEVHKTNEELLKMLNDKIQEQMKEFKESYLQSVAEKSEWYFNHLDEKITNCTKYADDYNKKMEEFEKNWKSEGNKGWYWHSYEYKELEKTYKYFHSEVVQAKYIQKNYTLDTYKTEQVEHATKIFNRNVAALCDRVFKKGLDIENVVVSGIGTDPKFFKMHITDGQHNLFARSIFAAENSDYMIAHFRFIITGK